jgi:biopolymer transport protein ExbB/TolQ
MLDWRSLVDGLGGVAIAVVVVLFAMSVVSLAIAADRFLAFRRADRQSNLYLVRFSRLLAAGQMKEAVEISNGVLFRHSPMARVLGAGLKEWLVTGDDADSAAADTREAMHQTAALYLADFRRGLPALATIGATAPFVGLFGTTFGIINAFAAMKITGSTGFIAISAGISEALVTTALGLLVAVPAVWAYNYFAGRIERLAVEIDRGAYETLRYCLQHPRQGQ